MNPRLTVTKPPVRLDHRDYEVEVERYVERVAPLPGVVAVATVGSVGTPGYSDIDYFVLVDERFDRSNARALFHTHPDRDRRIVLHAPIITSPALYGSVRDHTYLDDPVVLAGEIPSYQPAVDHDERQRTLLANLIDFCEARVVQHASARASGFVNQRVAMTAMWSSTHSAAIAERCGVPIGRSGLELIAALRADRNAWQHGERLDDEAFLELYHANERFTSSLLTAAVTVEADRRTTERAPFHPAPVTFRRASKTVICTPEATSITAKAMSLTVRGRRRPLSVIVSAPLAFATHLAAYGFVPTEPNHASMAPTDPLLLERARLAASYYEYLHPLGLSSANGPYIVLSPTRPRSFKHRAGALVHRLVSSVPFEVGASDR